MVSTTEDCLHLRSCPPKFKRTYLLLGYAGVLPFAFSTLSVSFSLVDTGNANSASFLGLYVPYVFITYSACILSFLAGTLWRGQFDSSHDGSKMLLVSNLLALVGWLSLQVIHISHYLVLMAIVILGAGYAAALVAEKISPSVSPHYLAFRSRLTFAVIVMHVLLLTMLLWSL
ncbi:MAG: hypothetical protein CBC09_03795 [Cellvibrionales bacterium TMED49]|nr:hypothetical protein [Porticoccaceae bacterium]MAH73709.1 hypothetical protein [Porticoccaceae bacterium]OUU37938.1 MAG: hypothetical protein CBC09_06200 [Cellvibrionales bacterium TMED49]OUU38945.1 MAG: hypothetical protein CBC09_03795 [Cellvibrionales bacterium TMED49]|tara:strand:+ start:531 stop:1049 length:519 start_codon:yes stop_codon:yes gene_type:complete